MNTSNAHLHLAGVSKRFGRFLALEDVDLTAQGGEFVSILGPSGCGKTTLLRVVAGLERHDSGLVAIGGRDVSALPVSRRNVGIVFQSYALFPNLTAEQNVAYGIKNAQDKQASRARVQRLFELVGLSGQERKYPAQLSGGQQQRVALARALAHEPRLLLLDEPLSALDAKVRERLRGEIRALQRQLGVTAVMVTHDQEEALTMADRILVMDRGRVIQCGGPREIYDRPATAFVASFIGAMNFFRNATKEADGRFRLGGLRLRVPDGAQIPAGGPAVLAIRPEDAQVRENGRASSVPDDAGNALRGTVLRVEYRGAVYRLSLRLHDLPEEQALFELEAPASRVRRLELVEGASLIVELPAERIRVYAA